MDRWRCSMTMIRCWAFLALLGAGVFVAGCSKPGAADRKAIADARAATADSSSDATVQALAPKVSTTPASTGDAAQREARALYWRGIKLARRGDALDAAQALEESAALDPGAIKTWINLARVRMTLNDRRGALKAADGALQIEEGSPDALHQRARALLALGRVDEALESVSEAHEAEPTNGYYANTLGYLLLEAGRFKEAVPYLEAASQLLPDVAYVRNNLGVAYERMGDHAKAAAEFEAAIAAGDPEGKAAVSLARVKPPIKETQVATAPTSGQ